MTQYGYIRVSTISQADNYSFEVQREKLKAFGVLEENILQEVHTATTMDRPVLNKLVGMVQENDEIIVVRFDRFDRNLSQGLLLIDKLKTKGVFIHSLDFPAANDTMGSQVVRLVLLWLAEYETVQRKTRQMEGIVLAKAAGKYKGRKSKIPSERINKVKNLYFDRH